MIDLYYWPTPNGHKITLMLEELVDAGHALEYAVKPVDIGAGDQFKPEYLAISPNNKMPAIVDHAPADGGAPISVFESGAILLGALVEVVSGQSLGAFLQENILGPLGMVDTSFVVPADKHHRIAEPFEKDPDGGIAMRLIDVRQSVALEAGGAGLASTSADYARFLQCLLNGGELDGRRILSKATVRYMTADHLGGIGVHRAGRSGELLPPGHGFGLGFAVRLEEGVAAQAGSKGLYFWGGIAGTTFFVDPAKDFFALMMIQAPNQRDYYRPLFRNLVYAALLD